MARLMDEVRRATLLNAMHPVSMSGDICSFNADNTLKLPKLTANIDTVLGGSGDPSLDNIRPITGWTGAKLTITGKNLFALSEYAKGNWREVADSAYADTYSGRKHSFYYLYGNAANNPDALGLLGIRVPLGRVTISFYKYYDNTDRVYFHYVGDDSWTNHSGNITTTGRKTYTSSSGKVCDGVALYTTQGSTANGKFGELQIEIGTSRTDYVPNTVNTFVCDWTDTAGTVYKGVLNILTGQLDITWFGFTVTNIVGTTASTSHWSLYSHGQQDPPYDQYYYAVIQIQNTGNLIAYENNTPNTGSEYGFCSYGRWRQAADDSVNEWRASARYVSSKHYIRIVITRQPQDMTVELVNDLLSSLSSPLTVIYRLKTPISVQLSAVEVRSLLGQNHLWADSGSVDLTYWKHN